MANEGSAPAWRGRLLRALARSGNALLAAEEAGISRGRAYTLRRKDADFARRWAAAVAKGARAAAADGAALDLARARARARTTAAGAELVMRRSTNLGAQLVRAGPGRWSARSEVAFLDALARTACVRRAAALAGFTDGAVYIARASAIPASPRGGRRAEGRRGADPRRAYLDGAGGVPPGNRGRRRAGRDRGADDRDRADEGAGQVGRGAGTGLPAAAAALLVAACQQGGAPGRGSFRGRELRVQLTNTLSGRQAVWAFALGCAAVTAGVLLHIPMFWMGKDMGFMLYGMPMGWDMIFGMLLIIGGCLVAAWGLLPRDVAAQRAAAADIVIAAPEDAQLGPAHWSLMLVLVVALIIDTMKPASLGFTVPGMVSEYRVPKETVSLVPFFALIGTMTGSVVWGVLADVYGRKATILLSAVMFVGTSICGAMPSLAWNIGMCFMMGLAAGGMLPVTYALLAEMMPSRHRGWSLVLVGGLGAGGGYFAASGAAAVLVPEWSWRILWLLNLPTGLSLVFLGALIPESAKFLLARGRVAEAQKVMAKFGSVARKAEPAAVAATGRAAHGALKGLHLYGKLVALSLTGLTWGLINFGLLLWLPNHFVSKGYDIEAASALLAESALIAFPTIFVCALVYSLWSTKWSLGASIIVTLLGLAGVLRMELFGGGSPVLPVALLIVGINGIIAILLPYTAESFPLKVRGRATGWVAACTKGGGVLAQALFITKLVPAMGIVAGAIMVPMLAALALTAWFGRETRGQDLRHLDESDEAGGVAAVA